MSQPAVEKNRAPVSLEKMIERDDRRVRLDSRHNTFTPEYRAWLKRQAAKRKTSRRGRNQ